MAAVGERSAGIRGRSGVLCTAVIQLLTVALCAVAADQTEEYLKREHSLSKPYQGKLYGEAHGTTREGKGEQYLWVIIRHWRKCSWRRRRRGRVTGSCTQYCADHVSGGDQRQEPALSMGHSHSHLPP